MCGKEKEGVQTGICNHCGRFGKTNRELALEWWNNHSNDWKRRRTDDYFGYMERLYKSLTDQEIEEIWKQIKIIN